MISKQGVGWIIGKQGIVVKEALSAASEAVAKGLYDATTLSAVDADLATGNIKGGVTVFGKLGTVALAEDVEGETEGGFTASGSGTYYREGVSVANESEAVLLTKNLTFDAASIAFAVAFAHCACEVANKVKLRLYMGGTLMQTSGYVPVSPASANITLRDFRVLSGSQDCELRAYNEDVATRNLYFYSGGASSPRAMMIAVGSVKLV